MITAKITVFVACFAGFWLGTESACEESALSSKRLKRRFFNQTVGAIVDFEDEITSKNIFCSNISQSLELKIPNPTRRKISEYREEEEQYDEYGYIRRRSKNYWKETNKESEVPANEFTIADSIIPTLPTSFLSSYADVVMLDLRSIHVKIIKPGAFKELTKLERLHLDGNEITAITAVIYSIASLQMLTLSNNNVTTIDLDMINLLVHLKHLDLSGNPIVKLLSNSENHVSSSLQTLLLNNTLIDEFNVSFSKELKLLNLSSNHFKDVDFSSYPKTKTLDLSNNQIFNTDEVESLSAELVNLNHNNMSDFSFMNNSVISHLNVSNNNLETITVSHSRALLTLDVSFNSISILQSDSFENLVELLRLYLQHNLLTAISFDSFRDLHALTHLDLSSNKIRKFSSGAFDNLANLEYLNIQHNRLKRIFHLNSLVKLSTLHADHNDIKFNLVDLTYFKHLKLVSFNHNPWSCGDLVKIYHEVSAIHVVVAKGDSLDVENLHGIACNDSSSDESAAADFVESVTGSSETETPLVRTISNDESLNQFFNFEFHKSKFYKYFEEDYAKSNFFSYLRNYKYGVGNGAGANSDSNMSDTAKLTSLAVKPESGAGPGALAVLNLILLTIVVFLLSGKVYVSYKMYIKYVLPNKQETISMQEGLVV